MIGGLIGEILADVVGEVLLGRPAPRQDPEQLEERPWNAWLGAVSAVLAGLAATCGLIALMICSIPEVFHQIGAPLALAVSSGSLALTLITFRCGRRALIVTKRHVGLARVVFGLSVLGLLASLSSLALGIVWAVKG